MALNQQDLELFAEKLATSMVTAQVELMQKTDTLTKVKKGAANMALSAVGALVAFMLLSWAGEYRDQSKNALRDSEKAFAAADEARTLSREAKSETAATIVANSKLEAMITPLIDKVAKLAALQEQQDLAPLLPQAPLPATAIEEQRDQLLDAQDKALYRQKQRSLPVK